VVRRSDFAWKLRTWFVIKAPHHIETSRLTLTPPNAGDAESIFERYAADPEVTRYLSWPQHRSVADTRAFLDFSAQEWERWPAGPYLIRLRADGRLIGGTGLSFNNDQEAVTGYVLTKDAWGQGYATEALRAMIDLARQLGVVTLEALCHPDHRASIHVLEKGGFRREGTFQRTEFPNLAPGVAQDTARYILTFT
jgi:RimJ/RimL family protein N-acetyltransferase